MDFLVFPYQGNLYGFLKILFGCFVSFVAHLFGLKETFPNLWSVPRITESCVFKLLDPRRFWLINFLKKNSLHSPFLFTPLYPPLESSNEDLMTRDIELFKFSIPLYI